MAGSGLDDQRSDGVPTETEVGGERAAMPVQPEACLVIPPAASSEVVRPAHAGRATLGGGTHADVTIDDVKPSRPHAEVGFRDGRLMARALGSHNGTRHNDRLLRDE